MRKIDQDIFGLVLAGGQSKRMGQDKTVMVYADKPQFQRAYELLEDVCARVFISTREEQAATSVFGDHPQIHDRREFQGKGPISGILSAMSAYPDVSWLILACDLPFVTADTLSYLLKNRCGEAIATAYKSQFDGLPEPLCALWERGHFKRIQDLMEQGITCPRKILMRSKAHLLDIQSAGEMDNINDPAEAAQALEKIRSKSSRSL